jgi:hypothetical protein
MHNGYVDDYGNCEMNDRTDVFHASTRRLYARLTPLEIDSSQDDYWNDEGMPSDVLKTLGSIDEIADRLGSGAGVESIGSAQVFQVGFHYGMKCTIQELMVLTVR